MSELRKEVDDILTQWGIIYSPSQAFPHDLVDRSRRALEKFAQRLADEELGVAVRALGEQR